MDKLQFFRAVLGKLGIAPSEQALTFLIQWSKHEERKIGAPHGFNPLNTTWNVKEDKGQTNFNKNAGYPVKNYSTFNYGVDATAGTLKLKYYKPILEFLKSPLPLEMAFAQSKGIASSLNTWGSRNFARKFSDNPLSKPIQAKQKSDNSKGGSLLTIALIAVVIGVVIYSYGA